MSLFVRSALVVLAAAVAGCASTIPLQRAQIDAIDRASPPAAVEQSLGKATPVAQFEFAAAGNQFLVRNYLLQTGTRREMTVVCTTFCMPVFYDVPVTAQYLVVQQLPSRAMHAWGTIEELSKDENPAVSAIMPALKARLQDVLAEKKRS